STARVSVKPLGVGREREMECAPRREHAFSQNAAGGSNLLVHRTACRYPDYLDHSSERARSTGTIYRYGYCTFVDAIGRPLLIDSSSVESNAGPGNFGSDSRGVRCGSKRRIARHSRPLVFLKRRLTFRCSHFGASSDALAVWPSRGPRRLSLGRWADACKRMPRRSCSWCFYQ